MSSHEQCGGARREPPSVRFSPCLCPLALRPPGATKAGITQLTGSLQRELADSPVKLHTLSPGMILTDLLLEGATTANKQVRGRATMSLPTPGPVRCTPHATRGSAAQLAACEPPPRRAARAAPLAQPPAPRRPAHELPSSHLIPSPMTTLPTLHAPQAFNILCEQPETVAAFLVPRIKSAVARNASGTYTRFLTPTSALLRLATAPAKIGRFFDAAGEPVYPDERERLVGRHAKATARAMAAVRRQGTGLVVAYSLSVMVGVAVLLVEAPMLRG
jgi:hypothetical protein